MDRRLTRTITAVGFTASLTGALAVAAPAAVATLAAPPVVTAGPGAAAPAPAASDPAAVEVASAQMSAAMQRDLQLTPTQVRVRLAEEDVADGVEKKLRQELGSSFGGAWLAADGRLVVATTDAGEAAEVRAAGARPRLVARTERQLNAVKTGLDAAPAPSSEVAGWYVDVTTNTVTVLADAGAQGTAEEFVADSGVDAAAVRVVASTEDPMPLYDVRGGDAYHINGSRRCSIGFSVDGGFVSAGHCGASGDSTAGYNQVSQGTFQDSSFPGNDYSWVAVDSTWTPTGMVNHHDNTTVSVAGSQEAAVGASICRSGSTTGWHCGTVQAKNATVNYDEGTVYGLTRTNVCAEPGDSGGSWLSGDQAQGVTSGGSGDCTSGGTTYFQPVNEILSAYGLTLVTSDGGGGGGGDEPCSGYEDTYTGTLSGAGDYDIHPGGSYYYSSSGNHSGCLAGPGDADLYLQRRSGHHWSTVASSLSSTSNETISYDDSSGYYRWTAYSYSGSGSYTLAITRP